MVSEFERDVRDVEIQLRRLRSELAAAGVSQGKGIASATIDHTWGGANLTLTGGFAALPAFNADFTDRKHFVRLNRKGVWLIQGIYPWQPNATDGAGSVLVGELFLQNGEFTSDNLGVETTMNAGVPPLTGNTPGRVTTQHWLVNVITPTVEATLRARKTGGTGTSQLVTIGPAVQILATWIGELGVAPPEALSASGSGANVTLTTTFQDIPGVSLSLGRQGLWLVKGVVDWAGEAGDSLLLGELTLVDGLASKDNSGQIVASAADGRQMAGQNWLVTVTSEPVTAKLQVNKLSGTGGSLAIGVHSKLVAIWIADQSVTEIVKTWALANAVTLSGSGFQFYSELAFTIDRPGTYLVAFTTDFVPNPGDSGLLASLQITSGAGQFDRSFQAMVLNYPTNARRLAMTTVGILSIRQAPANISFTAQKSAGTGGSIIVQTHTKAVAVRVNPCG